MAQPPVDDRREGRRAARVSSLVREVGRRLFEARSVPRRLRRGLMPIAITVFLIGGWLALRSSRLHLDDIRWEPLGVLLIVGIPLTIAGKACEYRISARAVDREVGLVESTRISIYSTAANLLPIPGSVLVRVGALRSLGARAGEALNATAFVGVVWLGTALTLAGTVTLSSRPVLGASSFFAGSAVIVLGIAILRRTAPAGRSLRRSLMTWTVVVEGASISVAALRWILALAALGVSASAMQGFVLALSGVFASSLGMFPGGLGVREVISAGLAPLVAVSASMAYLAASLDRLAGIVVHGIAAGIMWIVDTRAHRGDGRGAPTTNIESSEIAVDKDPSTKSATPLENLDDSSK